MGNCERTEWIKESLDDKIVKLWKLLDEVDIDEQYDFDTRQNYIKIVKEKTQELQKSINKKRSKSPEKSQRTVYDRRLRPKVAAILASGASLDDQLGQLLQIQKHARANKYFEADQLF